jgi:predicted transcriptional regulator
VGSVPVGWFNAGAIKFKRKGAAGAQMTHPIKITQAELKEVNELERELGWKQKHLAEMKDTLMALLRGGAEVEDGRFDAKLVKRIGRSVPWKREFIARLGEALANLVKRDYKTHVFFEVRVMEHAVPPLWRSGAGNTAAEN